jgi:hypothetical protein
MDDNENSAAVEACLACCAMCFIGFIENLVEYFNRCVNYVVVVKRKFMT